MQLKPGMLLIFSTIALRRASNCATMSVTHCGSPCSAFMAAYCAMEFALDVAWDWKLVMAQISTRGPAT